MWLDHYVVVSYDCCLLTVYKALYAVTSLCNAWGEVIFEPHKWCFEVRNPDIFLSSLTLLWLITDIIHNQLFG
jgi:hypothetical protein